MVSLSDYFQGSAFVNQNIGSPGGILTGSSPLGINSPNTGSNVSQATFSYLNNVPSYISSGQSTNDLVDLLNVKLPFLNSLPQINFQNILSNFKEIATNRAGINTVNTVLDIPQLPITPEAPKSPIDEGPQDGFNFTQAINDIKNTLGPTGLLIGAGILGVILLKKI